MHNNFYNKILYFVMQKSVSLGIKKSNISHIAMHILLIRKGEFAA